MTPPNDASRSTRRSLLRACAATGLTMSLSGCLSNLPPLGSKPSYGRVDVPDAGAPDYRRWLPAEWTDENGEGWMLSYAEPWSIDGPVPEEFVSRRAYQMIDLDHFGIGYENYDRLVSTNLATVIEADVSADEVGSKLAETGYEPTGTYRDYDLYAREDVPRRAAVRDGRIVWTNERIHDSPDVEATIDAGEGRIEQYHERDDAFAAITEDLGASRFLSVGTGYPALEPYLSEISADAFRFDGDAAYHVLLERYSPSVDLTRERVKRALEDRRGRLTREADTVDVTVDGRTSRVEARVPLAPDQAVDPLDEPPQVTWGGSFDAETQTATIRHELGDRVDADRLSYDLLEGRDVDLLKEPLWPDRETVGPGAEATVDLGDRPDADAVRLMFGDRDIGFHSIFTYPIEPER